MKLRATGQFRADFVSSVIIRKGINPLNALRQVVSLRLLRARRPRDGVEVAACGLNHRALEREVRPARRALNEGALRDAVAARFRHNSEIIPIFCCHVCKIIVCFLFCRKRHSSAGHVLVANSELRLLKPTLPTLLRPVALQLFEMQHAAAFGIDALLHAHVCEDVRLVPVGGAIIISINAAHSGAFTH